MLQPFVAKGQTKIDSLLYQLKKSRPDSNRVSLLNKLAYNYLAKQELSQAEFDQVFKHVHQAISLCDSLGLDFVRWKAKSLYFMGDALILSNKDGEGKNVFMQLINKAHDAGDKPREADTWTAYAESLVRANNLGPSGNDQQVAYTNALNIYREIKNRKGELDMSIEVGRYHGRMAEFDTAQQQFLALIKKSEAFNNYRLPYIYLLLSITNRYMGNYNKALGFVFHALKAMETLKDSSMQGDCYGELAELYQALNKPAESAAWYKKCISKREVIPGYPSFALHRTYSLMVGQLIKTGAQKEALSIIKDLQKRRPPNTQAESAVLYQCLAYCYDADNEYDSTEKYYLKTVEVYEESYKKLHMVDEIILLSYYDVANFYIKHHQYIKCRPFLDTLELKQSSMSISSLANAQLLLFKADSAIGKYLAAIRHFQQYKSLTDSIFNDKYL